MGKIELNDLILKKKLKEENEPGIEKTDFPINAESTIKCGEINFANGEITFSCNKCFKIFFKITPFLRHCLIYLNISSSECEAIINGILDCDENVIENEETETNFRLFGKSGSNDEVKNEISDDAQDEFSPPIFDDSRIEFIANDNDNTEDEKSIINFTNKLQNEMSATVNLENFGSDCFTKVKKKTFKKSHHKNYSADDNTGSTLPLKCKYNCGRTFQRKCDLSHHENRTHNTDGSTKIWKPKIKKFICETCGKCYQRKHYLIQHQRVHTGERPFACDLCSKTFTKRNNLMLHMRHHSQERKYKCQFCGKGLTDSNKLRMHEMIHTGMYPHQCDICQKKFPCKSKLNVHIKKHINDRIYKCEICDKRFLDPETLKGHAAVHSNEKPFACEICPSRFPRKGALRLHMNLHNDEKKYSCKICGMQFHQYNGIYSHYKRHGIKYSIAYEKGEVDGCMINQSIIIEDS